MREIIIGVPCEKCKTCPHGKIDQTNLYIDGVCYPSFRFSCKHEDICKHIEVEDRKLMDNETYAKILEKYAKMPWCKELEPTVKEAFLRGADALRQKP